MKTIGGYFELELPTGREYHENAIKLNSGRNALMLILDCKEYGRVFLPYYTCEAVLEPIDKLGVSYSFYGIDINLEPVYDFGQLQANEVLIYTNYFGLKDHFIERLLEYGCNIIVDNCQAFFSSPVDQLDCFYSPRKFFGVPDGGYLYMSGGYAEDIEQGFSYQHCTHLLKRIDVSSEDAYQDFLSTERAFSSLGITKLSRLSQRILASIDYGQVAERRRDNFNYLHERLAGFNELPIEVFYDFDGAPHTYPLLVNHESLRNHLINNKVYVARYWPNVFSWALASSFEHYVVTNLVALPIDQRYNKDDMKHIAELVSRFLGG